MIMKVPRQILSNFVFKNNVFFFKRKKSIASTLRQMKYQIYNILALSDISLFFPMRKKVISNKSCHMTVASLSCDIVQTRTQTQNLKNTG